MDRRTLGTKAEALARDYLLDRGLKFVCENFRCRAGELDLVLMDGPVLAIVEVRMRADQRFGGAAASVGWQKRGRIVRASSYLLLKHPELRKHPARFDVVTLVDAGSLQAAEIEWIKGAFEA